MKRIFWVFIIGALSSCLPGIEATAQAQTAGQAPASTQTQTVTPPTVNQPAETQTNGQSASVSFPNGCSFQTSGSALQEICDVPGSPAQGQNGSSSSSTTSSSGAAGGTAGEAANNPCSGDMVPGEEVDGVTCAGASGGGKSGNSMVGGGSGVSGASSGGIVVSPCLDSFENCP